MWRHRGTGRARLGLGLGSAGGRGAGEKRRARAGGGAALRRAATGARGCQVTWGSGGRGGEERGKGAGGRGSGGYGACREAGASCDEGGAIGRRGCRGARGRRESWRVGPARQLPRVERRRGVETVRVRWAGPVALGRFACGERERKEKKSSWARVAWVVGWWPIRGV
jgi:hypothetical protein